MAELDDLLSPYEDTAHLTDPEKAPDVTVTSPGPETEQVDPEQQEPASGSKVAESRSTENMESILLEPSLMEESIDLGTSNILPDIEDPDEALPVDLPLNEEAGKGGIEITFSENDSDKKVLHVLPEEDVRLELSQEPVGDITKYFQDQPADDLDIFESLAAEGEPRRGRVHLESHSSVSEEACPVDFEEKKGDNPLKPTPSTRSLAKFFSDDNNDGEGAQDFFDLFTAAETDDPLGVSCSSSGFPSLEQPVLPTESGIMVPPQTPPIPVGSPMPSPFHQLTSQFSDPGVNKKEESQSRTSSLGQGPEIMPLQAQLLSADTDDPFTLGLNISDIDRRNDAWIPSEITRQVLITVMTSPPGTVTLQADQLTITGIHSDESLGDPVRELVQRFLGEQAAQSRSCLAADSVSQDDEGLRRLIKAECWRAAIDLTGHLLTQCGQGVEKTNTPTKHTPYTLQLWFCRLSLMLQLRQYSEVDLELQAFSSLDKPDLYYEYYQDKYPGRRGSMVPFGLRVLHAELPQHLGKPQECLDRLYYIHAIVRKIISNLESGLAEDGSMVTLSEDSRKASRELWESREVQLLYGVSNCLLSIKDYSTALKVLEDLLKRDEGNKEKLLCGIARIYLQMGDIISGQKQFALVDKLINPDDPKAKCQSFMNRGFLSLGQNQFQESYNSFKAAVELDPRNAVAVNNMAVCALYTGQLKDALNTFEELVNTNPETYLQEGILFNLCTLYELESSHAIFKKQQLLSMVSKHKGNGFNVACLKIV